MPPNDREVIVEDMTRPPGRSWRDRVWDAVHYGERVSPPLVWGRDLGHRAVLLMMVAAVTALLVGIAAMPGVAIFGKTVGGVADRFDVEVGDIELPAVAQRSVVVSREGKTLATLSGEENRVVVDVDEVPKQTQHAVLAIEDAGFYEHHGVDLPSLVRALLSNVKAGGLAQGGSTITQQLVKNLIVGTERSLDRKILEAQFAVELERQMSKKRILELYLNEAYFGRGVYGIGTAAEYYFGKRVRKLTLAESALLAGIIKSPENLEPIANPEGAKERRALVLRRMVDEGFVTASEAEAAAASELGAKARPIKGPRTPYFVEYVKSLILSDERYGQTIDQRIQVLFQGGLRIETTLDFKLQDVAQKAARTILDLKDDPDSALVSIDPKTGAVIAMVGGRDFGEEKYNLAVQGRRQPGSTFKPMTMVAALAAGVPPTQPYNAKATIKVTDQAGKPYEVSNYDRRGRGFIDMREATAFSVNTYYIQLIDQIGPEAVVEMSRKLGIETELQPYTSLALGTIEVTPFEMASAYATLAANGRYCEPFAITKVLDATGAIVHRGEPACQQVIDPSIAALATDILREIPERGTGRANGRIGRPVTGKTGTTEELSDAWYAGYTPQFATVVWIGFRGSRTPLRNIHGLPSVFGGTLPAMIWKEFMLAAHDDLEVEQFPPPPPPRTSTVPKLVGEQVADARALLEEAGLNVRVVTVPSWRSQGRVLSQEPAAETEVAVGTMVTLEVSDGTGPSPTPSPSPSPTPSATPSPKPSPTGSVSPSASSTSSP